MNKTLKMLLIVVGIALGISLTVLIALVLYNSLSRNDSSPLTLDLQPSGSKGYYVHVYGTETTTDEYGTTMTWVSELYAYTCDEDPNNATWEASYNWDWRTESSDGSKGSDDFEEDVTFYTEKNEGHFYLNDGDDVVRVNINISDNIMDMWFTAEPLGSIISEGEIIEGDERCK